MRKGYKVTVSLNKKPLKKLEKKKLRKTDITEEELAKGIEIVNSHKEKQEDKRKSRIGKTLVEVKNELVTQKEIEEENERSHKRFKVIVFFLIIAIIIYLFFYFGPILGISIYKNSGIDENNKIDISSTASDYYDTYCNDFLMYTESKLVTYNLNGKKNWEYELQEVFTPKIYITDKYMAVVNTANSTIYFFENKKERFTKKIDGDISCVYINENGNIVVEYSTSGYKKILSTYTKSGKLLYTTYLSVSSILDVKFMQDDKKLLVVTSDSTTFNISTVLNIVDSSKEQDNMQEIAKFEDSLIYDMKIKNKNAIILLDSKLVNCNLETGTVTEIMNFNDTQILFNGLSDNYYTYVEKELGEQSKDYNIKTMRFDNTDISTTKDENSPKFMKNSGYLNYFVYQDKLKVVNKWGVIIKEIEITFPPKDIIVFNHEKSVALIYSNKVYFLNM